MLYSKLLLFPLFFTIANLVQNHLPTIIANLKDTNNNDEDNNDKAATKGD